MPLTEKSIFDMNSPEGNAWANAVGSFVCNFGMIEHLSYLWLAKLGGVQERDKAITRKLTLRKRVDRLKRMIDHTSLGAEAKRTVKSLWDEVSELAELRNRIAHNPFIVAPGLKGGFAAGIADVRKMTSVNKGPLKLLSLKEVHSGYSRAAKLAKELLKHLLPYYEKP